MKKIILLIMLCSGFAYGRCHPVADVEITGVSFSSPVYPFSGELNGLFTLRRYGDYDHSDYCHFSYVGRTNEYGVRLFISLLVYGDEYYVQETLIRDGVALQANVFIGDGEELPLANAITINGGEASVILR